MAIVANDYTEAELKQIDREAKADLRSRKAQVKALVLEALAAREQDVVRIKP